MKKKPEDKRKKSRKFVSCNHKMHFKCFNEYIIIHLNKEFECPLCKKLSNIILYDFSDITNNNCDIIKGLNYSEGKIKLDEFYKKEQGDKLKELFISNIITFENYCSKLFHKQILINDFNEDKILLEKTLKLITDDFEEFTMYYSRTSKKQEQIEIWKNILYNLRLLIQYNIIKITDGLLQMINNILKVNKVENFEDLLIKYDFGYIINIYIIIAFILFESNEENKEKIKIIFQSKFLIYFIYIAFIKDNNNGIIDKSFLNNKTEIKKAFDLYYLKYKIFLLLYNEKEENINININLEQIMSIIKSNPDFIYLINSPKKDSYLSYLKEQFLEIPEFKIINLPENGIEFFNMSNGYCSYCNKKNIVSFLCLFCGSKVCNSRNCTIENGTKKGKEYSTIYHSIKCSGGNGLFLDVKNTEIVYILKRRIINSNICIYLNSFGETLKDKYLNDEYKLNKEELNKGINKFIDMTFRRQKQKIHY